MELLRAVTAISSDRPYGNLNPSLKSSKNRVIVPLALIKSPMTFILLSWYLVIKSGIHGSYIDCFLV